MGILNTGPGVKNHISPKKARELIARFQTMHHPLSLVYRRLPPQRPHLLFHHIHHRILYLTLADTPKILYPKEVEVRARSYGETRCINQQKPKTKIKMKDAKKYKAIHYMNCQSGCRSSERIWSINVVLQSHEETWAWISRHFQFFS